MSQVLEYDEIKPSLKQRLRNGIVIAKPWIYRLRYLILPGIVVAFLVQGLRMAPGYRGQMNPDGVGYLTIARQNLQGHYADAVNAYWSPLYSWLLMPLMAAGVESLLAVKVLAVLVGAGMIATTWWLLRNLGVAVELRAIACLTLFPILYHFGMEVTTPDLLTAATLLLYGAHLTMPDYGKRRWDAAVSGVLGGLAYLAKAYALPVVLAHYLIVNGSAFFVVRSRARRIRVLVDAGVGLLAFALVAGTWSGILTHKYGYFTTGSTGKFNIAYNGPRFSQPMHRGSLIPPSSDTGTSSWDDATTLTVEPWTPWATVADRQLWEKNRVRNEKQIEAYVDRCTWLFWPIAVVGLLVAGSRLDRRPRRPGAVWVGLVALYPLGYWLLHVEGRFLYLLCVGLLVIGTFAVARVTAPLWTWIRVPLRVTAMVVVAWSFLSPPEWTYGRDPWATALDRWSIADRWDVGKENIERSTALAGVIPARAKVASNVNWSPTLYQAYLLNLRYYGDFEARANQDAHVQAELATHGVEYFWVWGGKRYGFLRNVPEISGGKVANLRIYDLRPRPTTAPTTQP